MLQLAPWRFVVWNLFLAIIPVALAYGIAWGVDRWTLRRGRVPWIAWLPLVLAWLAFLPNTCYLITEWRHFLFDPPMPYLLQRADADRAVMLELAELSLFYLVYSGLGILLFTLSIRPIQRVLRAARVNLLAPGVAFYLLTSLGVYLGLIVRLNSWDLITRPPAVWAYVADALSKERLLGVIVVFAVLLWVAYEMVNIWVDGVALRVRRAMRREAAPIDSGEPVYPDRR